MTDFEHEHDAELMQCRDCGSWFDLARMSYYAPYCPECNENRDTAETEHDEHHE